MITWPVLSSSKVLSQMVSKFLSNKKFRRFFGFHGESKSYRAGVRFVAVTRKRKKERGVLLKQWSLLI